MAKNKYIKNTGQLTSKLAKTSSPPSKKPSERLYILLIVLFTICTLWPTLDNEFVNWDDDKNFLENPSVKDATFANFGETTKKIFSEGVIGNYNPLPIWTFAIEKIVFGFDNPFQWHLHNLILHVLCVLFVYLISRSLGLAVRGSVLTALLFGIHPMRVESVAWVTERKDVLFALFYFWAIWLYIKQVSAPTIKRNIAITFLFLLALLSKIQAVSLPLSLLAVDYLMRPTTRFEWKWIIDKTHYFIMSLVFGLVGIYFLKEFGSLASAETTTNFTFFQRLFVGSYSYMVYIIKLFVPYQLSPLYPYPDNFPSWMYPTMVMLPLTLYGLFWTLKKNKKPLFFGWMFFIVNVFFMLQILGAGQGFLADRFTYVPYFGLFFIMGYYFQKGIHSRYSKPIWGITLIFVLVMTVMSFQQSKIWKNSGTLWTHVLKYYNNTTLPYGNRANYYRDNGQYTLALADYDKTISMKENQPQAYNSRAKLYFTLAKGNDTLQLALNDYNKAIQFDTANGEFYINRGATYARLGDINKAIVDLDKGLLLKPDHATGYINRSIMFQMTGRVELALKDIETYLTMRPHEPDIWYEKGRALRLLGRTQEAIPAYTKALEYNSSNKGLFVYERSKAYAELTMMVEAKADLTTAIQLNYADIDPSYRASLGL